MSTVDVHLQPLRCGHIFSGPLPLKQLELLQVPLKFPVEVRFMANQSVDG
ncbi:MAG: hypothetical protein WB565_14470 [Acidimicrobiales bacterium]